MLDTITIKAHIYDTSAGSMQVKDSFRNNWNLSKHTTSRFDIGLLVLRPMKVKLMLFIGSFGLKNKLQSSQNNFLISNVLRDKLVRL